MIKCEHCGTEPVQNCADCRDPMNAFAQRAEKAKDADYCPVCRNLRPDGCPGCNEGGIDMWCTRDRSKPCNDDDTCCQVEDMSPEIKERRDVPVSGSTIKTSSPYILGCVARAADQYFLSNPIPRTEKRQRDQWFNGWLDTNDRLTGADVPVRLQCPCQYVTVVDLRIIQLLRS